MTLKELLITCGGGIAGLLVAMLIAWLVIMPSGLSTGTQALLGLACGGGLTNAGMAIAGFRATA